MYACNDNQLLEEGLTAETSRCPLLLVHFRQSLLSTLTL